VGGYDNSLARLEYIGNFINHDLGLAFDDLSKGIKGEIYAGNPWPVSKAIIVTFPVTFLIIDFVATALGMYSITSTIRWGFAFSSSDINILHL
jgi:hypothetical protein